MTGYLIRDDGDYVDEIFHSNTLEHYSKILGYNNIAAPEIQIEKDGKAAKFRIICDNLARIVQVDGAKESLERIMSRYGLVCAGGDCYPAEAFLRPMHSLKYTVYMNGCGKILGNVMIVGEDVLGNIRSLTPSEIDFLDKSIKRDESIRSGLPYIECTYLEYAPGERNSSELIDTA